jgi:hypothetical protein
MGKGSRRNDRADEANDLVSEGGTVFKAEQVAGGSQGPRGGVDAVTELLAGKFDPSIVDEVRRFRCGGRRPRTAWPAARSHCADLLPRAATARWARGANGDPGIAAPAHARRRAPPLAARRPARAPHASPPAWEEEDSSLDAVDDLSDYAMHGLRMPPRDYDDVMAVGAGWGRGGV